MKVFKYRFLEGCGEENNPNNSYRGVPLQLGDEFVLLCCEECFAPDEEWQELETYNCKVVEHDDNCEYDKYAPELEFHHNSCHPEARAWATTNDAPVRLLTDEALEIEIDDFYPRSSIWEGFPDGIELKAGDKVDILIHDDREENIGESNVYAILEGRIDKDLVLGELGNEYPEFEHSFHKILKKKDYLIRLAKD